MSTLLNTEVAMRISDPWELGETLNWKTFDAKIIAVSGDDILIQLLTPFIYKGTNCEFFIATPRHEGDHAEKLQAGESLFCGLTRITHEQANSNSPFDLKSWRGGITAIGNLDPISQMG
jgi:hypothetical protein